MGDKVPAINEQKPLEQPPCKVSLMVVHFRIFSKQIAFCI